MSNLKTIKLIERPRAEELSPLTDDQLRGIGELALLG